MKFGGKKIAEDNEKQTVRRVCCHSKVPGICWDSPVGTKAAAAPSPVPPAGYREEN